MLKDVLKKGVKLVGLFRIIKSGMASSTGSWTLTHNRFSPNVITFFADHSGDHVVRYLPYRLGQNAASDMGGDEVISGEFSGCIMGVYGDAGHVVVNHVDTAKDNTGAQPQKDDWEAAKAEPGFHLLNEHSTHDQLENYLLGPGKGHADPAANRYTILCIASPTAGYDITQVIVQCTNEVYQVMRVD